MPTQQTLNVFIDGASRGNPGPAGLGAFAYTDNKEEPFFAVSYSFYRYTNNVAEYAALVLALQTILQKGWKGPVHIHADSLLVVKQMNREYRVKDPLLIHWNQLANKLKAFVPCVITHIRREYNTEADALANAGLDEKIKPSEEFEKLWRGAIPRSFWPQSRTAKDSPPPKQSSLF
ncbi:MAG: hypothetical protein QG632_890 [Candidatus Dependentiae bacterium]|nr:hypothetical protein [Candidatus Dependentiae bacterium]